MRIGITTYLKLLFSGMVINAELLESAKSMRTILGAAGMKLRKRLLLPNQRLQPKPKLQNESWRPLPPRGWLENQVLS